MEHLRMPMPVRDVQKLYWWFIKLLASSTTACRGFEGVKLDVCVNSGSRSDAPSVDVVSGECVLVLRRVKAFLMRSPVLGIISVACRNCWGR